MDFPVIKLELKSKLFFKKIYINIKYTEFISTIQREAKYIGKYGNQFKPMSRFRWTLKCNFKL